MRRRTWAKQTNAGFLPKPPGGWSAKGQPCDAFHAFFRVLTDRYEDQCLGYGHNIFRRPRPEDIPVSGCHIRKHLSIQQIIECNIWAWHEMPDAQFRPRHHIYSRALPPHPTCKVDVQLLVVGCIYKYARQCSLSTWPFYIYSLQCYAGTLT